MAGFRTSAGFRDRKTLIPQFCVVAKDVVISLEFGDIPSGWHEPGGDRTSREDYVKQRFEIFNLEDFKQALDKHPDKVRFAGLQDFGSEKRDDVTFI